MVKKTSLVIILLFTASLIWTASWSRPDGKSHIWTLVSKGQVSLIIRSGVGEFALINPRPGMLEELGSRLPFYQRSISLVLVTDPKDSQILKDLSARFDLQDIWQVDSDINAPNRNKVVRLSGQQTLSWQEFSFDVWSLPNQSSYLRISRGRASVALAGSGSLEFWRSIPNQSQVDILILSSGVKSFLWGTDLLTQLHPELVLAEDPSGAGFAISSPSHREIVWDQDSWYINSSQ